MRVLRVTPDLYPLSRGGIAVHTYLLSKSQSRAGLNLTVLTHAGRRSPGDNLDFNVVQFRGFRDFFGNPFLPDVVSYVRQHADEFDVLHLHSHLFVSTALAAFAGARSKLPIVVTCHGVRSAALPFQVSDLYLRTVGQRILSAARLVLCYTQSDAILLARLAGISTLPTRIIPNGVPLDLFYPRSESTARDPLVLWAGRMVRHKGLDVLLTAMKEVVGHFPAARLLLLGTGPEIEKLRALTQQLGIADAVSFREDVPFEQMPEVYNTATVCVVPSTTEGMPRVLMEAAACGVPVVASKLPQLDVLSEKGVLLFESGSSAELARRLVALLSDLDLARNLGRQARLTALKFFDWENTARLTTDALLSAAQPSSR